MAVNSEWISKILMFCLALVVTAPVAVSAEEDWQKGEQILPVNQAPPDAPLRRHSISPWYQLTHFRKFDRADGALGFSFDFRREADGVMGSFVSLVIRTKAGRISTRLNDVFSPIYREKQGTYQGEIRALTSQIVTEGMFQELELWLEATEPVENGVVKVKVSNSVTLGNPSEKTFARHWTAEETTQLQLLERKQQPPPPVPRDYQLVVPETKLLPGMPILAGLMGAWSAAEVIDPRPDGTVLIRYENSPTLQPRPRHWLALANGTKEIAVKNPASFKPSLRVLPGGDLPLEDGYQPVDDTTPLVPGVRLKSEHLGRWQDLTVLETEKAGPVRICFDMHKGIRAFDKDVERSSLVISNATLEELKRPGAKEKFNAQLEEQENSFERKQRPPHRRLVNQLKIAIPDDAVAVTPDIKLEVGMKLGAPRGGSWSDVTIRRLNRDGTVFIRWDRLGAAWDEDAERKDLIISKTALANLKKNPAAMASGAGSPVAGSTAGKPSPGSVSKEIRYRVVLRDAGNDKVGITKLVAEATGLELKDAKEFVESGPFPVKQGLSRIEAEQLKKKLEERGAKVEMEKQ